MPLSKTRRRTDAAQLRLRGQTPQYDGAARDACRSGGYVRPLDASARQNKVPRLANDRRVLEDVLATTAEQDAAVGVRG